MEINANLFFVFSAILVICAFTALYMNVTNDAAYKNAINHTEIASVRHTNTPETRQEMCLAKNICTITSGKLQRY